MMTEEKVMETLNQVMDPEIPVLSVVKLGIVKNVQISGGKVEVDMVPTFAGCPAIEIMRSQMEKQLLEAGAEEVEIHVKFKQAWSTNEMTKEGKKTLKEFGISPPPTYEGEVGLELLEHAECPKCGSTDTKLMSSFGPTACRAIHHCNSCHETFEQMKPL